MDINQLPTLRNNSKQTASNKWEYWEKKGRRRTVCSIGFFSYCVFDLNAKQRTVPVFFSLKKKTCIFFNPLLLSLPLCVVLKRPGSFFSLPLNEELWSPGGIQLSILSCFSPFNSLNRGMGRAETPSLSPLYSPATSFFYFPFVYLNVSLPWFLPDLSFTDAIRQ